MTIMSFSYLYNNGNKYFFWKFVISWSRVFCFLFCVKGDYDYLFEGFSYSLLCLLFEFYRCVKFFWIFFYIWFFCNNYFVLPMSLMFKMFIMLVEEDVFDRIYVNLEFLSKLLSRDDKSLYWNEVFDSIRSLIVRVLLS